MDVKEENSIERAHQRNGRRPSGTNSQKTSRHWVEESPEDYRKCRGITLP